MTSFQQKGAFFFWKILYQARTQDLKIKYFLTKFFFHPLIGSARLWHRQQTAKASFEKDKGLCSYILGAFVSFLKRKNVSFINIQQLKMSVDLNLYTPSKCIQMSISFGLFVDFVFVYKSLFEEILNKVPGFLRIHKNHFLFF